jgi:hypothetical protein
LEKIGTILETFVNCDFKGGDIRNQRSKGEDCGGICESRSDCTHFVWTNYQDGTCWLKGGQASESSAQDKNVGNAVCGLVKNKGGGVTVKGTYWAQKSESGGCQMPSGDYLVTDAIALGQQPELWSLIWRQGLCGQVLYVDCGHGNLEAVVASTCNLGSGSCGVDMIQKTCNKATNNQIPGIASCKVKIFKIFKCSRKLLKFGILGITFPHKFN